MLKDGSQNGIRLSLSKGRAVLLLYHPNPLESPEVCLHIGYWTGALHCSPWALRVEVGDFLLQPGIALAQRNAFSQPGW